MPILTFQVWAMLIVGGAGNNLLGEVRVVSRHVVPPASNQESANARKT